MPTFRYNKLVRDKIVDFHIACGHAPDAKYLKDKQLVQALCKKLHEEADEVDGALTVEQLVEEVADVQQIINDLCKAADIPRANVEAVRKLKERKKGGFMTGAFITTVTIPNEDDEWARYCRREPKKYPEVRDDKEE